MYEVVGQFDHATEMGALAEALPFSPDPGYGLNQDERILETLFRPYIGGLFPGKWERVFLSRILPYGSIHDHKDASPLAVPRYHLVLLSNEHSWCMHDNVWGQLSAGGIYVMEPTLVHAAINWGCRPRIHLVIDSFGYAAG